MIRTSDREFKIEQLLVKHGLWEKVEQHKNTETCPLCEQKYEEGDLAVFCLGWPIHTRCVKQLRKKK